MELEELVVVNPLPKAVEKLSRFFEEQNICDILDEDQLDEIYQQCSNEYDSSYSLMSEKIQEWKKSVELVCLHSDRDKPFDGASDVVYPLTSNAVINLASKAFNAFFPDDEIYKGKIIGNDNGMPDLKQGKPMVGQDGQPIMVDVGIKSKTANRLALVMNYQANTMLSNWKADTIQLFYSAFTFGTVYRKEGYDILKQRNFSNLILPDKIIINKNCNTLENSVYSEVIFFTRNEIQANINRGLFINYDYEANTPVTEGEQLGLKMDNTTSSMPVEENEEEYKFIEQHTFLDLDKDGFKEPYSVLIDASSQKVVRIVPDFKLDTVKVAENDKIFDIERIRNLVVYRCFPSFDGSFFGVGLPFFLFNINSSINTSINQLIDSMHLKIKGGGFVSNDLNLRGGALTYKMGEFKKIMSLNGGSLAEKFFTPPIPEPSPVMLALLQQMIEAGKDIGLLKDVLTGNVTANMAPTTFMGLTETAISIENSIFKCLNESFKEEIKVRRKLNADHFNKDLYAKITGESLKDIDPKADFLNENVDIVLLTDSSNITKSQKMAKAQLFSSLMQDPFYNQIEIRKKFNESIGMPELNMIVAPPPPAPDANMIIAGAEDKKAEAKLIDAQVNAEETFAKIQEMANKLVAMQYDMQLKESQSIKNIVEAAAKEKEMNLRAIKDYQDTIIKNIEQRLYAEQIELQRKQAQINNNQSEQNDNDRDESEGVSEANS